MIDDLVKRLREYRIGCGIHCSAYDAREPLDECIEAADRIEKLEAAMRNVTTAWDIWQKTKDSNSFTELFASILELTPDMSVYKEGYRAVEEAMGHPSPEFWIEKRE